MITLQDIQAAIAAKLIQNGYTVTANEVTQGFNIIAQQKLSELSKTKETFFLRSLKLWTAIQEQDI